MIIRPAVPADNEALCRMELLAPQGTAIRLTERRFDFFSRARQFPGSILVVAADEDSGRLIGVLGGAPVKLRVGDRERMGGFLFDFRSNPEYQRGLSRAVYLLWRAVEEQLLGQGIEFVYGLVKADNPAASMYFRMDVKERGRRTFWTLPVYRRKPVPAGILVQRKLDAVADYHEAGRWYKDHDLWPVLPDPGVLQPPTDRYLHAQLGLDGASLKIWDGTADYERVVTAMTWTYNTLRPLTTTVGKIIPLPRIPKVGEPLRTWFLYDLRLPNGPGPLRPLLAMANNLALEAKVDYLIVSASEGEPELAGAGRGALVTLDYLLVVKEYQPVPEISPRFYLDIRMV